MGHPMNISPSHDPAKIAAAKAACSEIRHESLIGVGTGSTVQCFLEILIQSKIKLEGAVSSSHQTTALLKSYGIPVLDLNQVGRFDFYVDGADEANPHRQLIKGGGGALTSEKILAACAKKFICIATESKYVQVLGRFALPIEVLPMARSYVARELVKLGGTPVYRQGFVTDHGNHILDVHGLQITDPKGLETQINQITGVVCNGIFAQRPADKVILGAMDGSVRSY